MKVYSLESNVDLPSIGYGLWKNKDLEILTENLRTAYEVGFRLIDGAKAYQNEPQVGQAIKQAGLDRDNLILTSKVPNQDHGYDSTIAACKQTLKDLQTDYLDLYLIHWPVVEPYGNRWQEDNVETWQAMLDLKKEGLVKAVGVSNFSINHLENLAENGLEIPEVNQILYHPGVIQIELVEYCHNKGMVIEAYSPLAALEALNQEEFFRTMETKYQKSGAQILLRFVYQSNIIPLTKSVHNGRIRENIDIFDFEIDSEDFITLRSWSHPDFKEPDNQNERPTQVS